MNGFEDPGHHHTDGHGDIPGMPTDEAHPLWAGERVEMKSVGIDIGSSTSHLMFSRLVMRRKGALLSSQFEVVSREIICGSRVLLTPFVDGMIIATKPLSDFISEAYREAMIVPEEIDTGAVIITGEAARRENAEAIVSLFSKEAGKFVCATAGPNLEARMAAYGSGAVDLSRGTDGEGTTVMNVDVGGGTTKIAIAVNGSVVETVCVNVGARLIEWDKERRIVRMEKAGRLVLDNIGLGKLEVGDRIQPGEEREAAGALAACLFEVLERQTLSPLCRELMLTPALSFTGEIGRVTFSGGVSEYIYGYEDKDYGDMGGTLALEIRQRASRLEFGIPVGEPVQRIRATVIGASQYTVQLSGNTIFVSGNGVLPLRNLQVITPIIRQGEVTPDSVEAAVKAAFRRFDMHPGERPVALAIHWPFGPAYSLLRPLAEGIATALRKATEKKLPLVLVFDADIAKLVGNILARELAVDCDLVSIDGIELQDFDFIDIGEELPDVSAVPVIIKSLIFAPKRDRPERSIT